MPRVHQAKAAKDYPQHGITEYLDEAARRAEYVGAGEFALPGEVEWDDLRPQEAEAVRVAAAEIANATSLGL